MLDQNFTAKNFLRLTSLADIIKFKLGRERKDYLESLERVAQKINSGTYDYNDFKNRHSKKHKTTTTPSAEGTYALRHISKIISRLYKVKQANRDTISNQVKTLLEETSEFHIVKCDIKSFFDSIPRDRVIETLHKDRLLSFRARQAIDKIFASSAIAPYSGLPRGTSISSPLSELYIRDFDKKIKLTPGVYYYARYVDDFIIFCHSDPEQVLKSAKNKLHSLNLDLNYQKLQILNPDKLINKNKDLIFLGYKFKVEKAAHRNKVTIEISPNRIRKLKTRIILALLDYANNGNRPLLKNRLKFLTGNYKLHKKSLPDGKGLMAGFYYNNKLATNKEQIADLDRFLMKSITSKNGGIQRRLGPMKTLTLKRELKGITFENGFTHQKQYKLSAHEIEEIRRCWSKEKDYEKK